MRKYILPYFFPPIFTTINQNLIASWWLDDRDAQKGGGQTLGTNPLLEEKILKPSIVCYR